MFEKKYIKRSYLITTLICLSLILFACNSVEELQTSTPYEVLDVPTQKYSGIAWFPDGKIVTSVNGEFYKLEEGELTKFEIEPESDECIRIKYKTFHTLPDERLGISQTCIIGSGIRDRKSNIVAYDWADKSLTVLTSESEGSGFSWNPSMTKGVQNVGNLSGTIQWVTAEGSQPIDLTLGSGDREWSLATNYFRDVDDSIKTGIARSSTWSPDGSAIAFFATENAPRSNGIQRAHSEYSLFLLDPNTMETEKVLGDVYYPTIMDWSPNGQWLAFGARAGSPERFGLWMYSPSAGDLKAVLYNDTGVGFDWSPDGKSIIVNLCDDHCQNPEEGIEPDTLKKLVIYDVSDLLVVEVGAKP